MPEKLDEDGAMDVAAMQFAGGLSAAKVAELWDRDVQWVEDAIRRAMLQAIPKRSGGLKEPRAQARAERRQQAAESEQLQQDLEW